MPENQNKKIPWIFLPFVALWELLTFILKATGRLLAAILGLLFLIAGIALSSTVVALPLGVPFIILGFLLLLRSLF